MTPLDPLFVTPQDEDFWVATTAPADFDGDGDLDIAVLGYYVVYSESVVERLVLLRNDGPAGPGEWEFAYVDVPLGGLSSGASDLAWADVDGDGDQDLVMGSNGSTVLYRNDAGTLVMTDTVLPGYSEDNDQADFDLNSLSFADYDNDGGSGSADPIGMGLEPVRVPNGRCAATTARTGREGSCSPRCPRRSIPPRTPRPSGRTSTAIRIWTSSWSTWPRSRTTGSSVATGTTGRASFVGEDILGTLTVEHGEVEWGDYDEDGDHDVLVAGHIVETDGTINRALRIYRNDAETYVPVGGGDLRPVREDGST